ncbi:MAG: hypothetical protein K5892_07975 [Acholeplasmatales bacterium]|nr:hypothetical protein [Acholeplasmatales bacterium]
MKIAKILSTVLAILATILFIIAFAFIKWKRSSANATPSDLKTYVVLFVLIGICSIAFIAANKQTKYAILVPAIALIEVGTLFRDFVNNSILSTESTITDIFLINNNTIIAFLMFAAFIVFTVLSFNKKFKWASIYCLAYVAMYIVPILYYLPSTMFEKNNDLKIITLTSLGLGFAYIAFIAFYAKNLFKCDCCCCKDNAEKCECASNESPVAEETNETPVAEETNEAPVAEETNETPVTEGFNDESTN